MKKTMKRFIACFMAALLMIGAAGCYSENNLWAAKKGDISLPIGGYIYFLYDAYSKAAAEVPTDKKVLSGTIDEMSAKDWIHDQAKESSKYYMYLEQKFSDLGLSLTDEELAEISSYTSFYWDSYSYGTTLEPLGVSRESFESVVSRPEYLYTDIFNEMYGSDGEFAVSDEELGEYYEDNYYSYEYFTVSLDPHADESFEAGEEGEEEAEPVELTDAEKEKIRKELKEYVDDINDDEENMSVLKAATEYQEGHDLEESPYQNPVARIDAASSDIEFAVLDEEELGDAVFVDSGDTLTVARRLEVSKWTQNILENEDERLGVLSGWKSTEFSDYIKSESEKIEGIVFNDYSIGLISLNKFVNDDNKMGTSQPEDDSSESEESADSSLESIDAGNGEEEIEPETDLSEESSELEENTESSDVSS